MQTRWLIAYTFVYDSDVRSGDLTPKFANIVSSLPPPEWLLNEKLAAEEQRESPGKQPYVRNVTLLASWPLPKKTVADQLYEKTI